jgi:hypothetical protein
LSDVYVAKTGSLQSGGSAINLLANVFIVDSRSGQRKMLKRNYPTNSILPKYAINLISVILIFGYTKKIYLCLSENLLSKEKSSPRKNENYKPRKETSSNFISRIYSRRVESPTFMLSPAYAGAASRRIVVVVWFCAFVVELQSIS